jgi:hypothetical protein
MCRYLDTGGALSRTRLLAYFAHQGEGQLVNQRKRTDRVAGLGCGLLHRRRRDALADQGDRLVHELEDHPAGEKASAVVHHDGGLADLPGHVDGPGQRRVAGLRPDDDFEQRHPVPRVSYLRGGCDAGQLVVTQYLRGGLTWADG